MCSTILKHCFRKEDDSRYSETFVKINYNAFYRNNVEHTCCLIRASNASKVSSCPFRQIQGKCLKKANTIFCHYIHYSRIDTLRFMFYRHSLIHAVACLRDVHSLFQSELCTESDIVPPSSVLNILSFR